MLDTPKNKTQLLILMVILLFSLFLRLYKISEKSIWQDEANPTIYHAQGSIKDNIQAAAFDVHPPLHNILLSVWIRLFDISELSTRSLSAIFGTLSVFFIFLLAYLMFDGKTALYSATLLAISPLHIWYSQEVRSYALLCLLTLLSFYSYIIYIQSTNKKSYAIAYIIISTLLIYTHLFGIFVIISQNLHYITSIIHKGRFKSIRKWLIIQMIILLLFLPWIYFLIVNGQLPGFVSGSWAGSWIPKPGLYSIRETFVKFAGSSFHLKLFIVLITAYFLKIGFFKKIEKKQKQLREHLNKVVMLFLWLLLPITIVYLYSIWFTPFYLPKYFISSSLALYILLALAISRTSKRRFIQALIIFLVILPMPAILNIQYNVTKKEQWNEVVNYINALNNSGIILITPGYMVVPFSYYYDRDCFTDYDNIFPCLGNKNVFAFRTIDELKTIDISNSSVWLITSRHYTGADTKKKTYSYLDENKHLSRRRRYGAINIYYYS